MWNKVENKVKLKVEFLARIKVFHLNSVGDKETEMQIYEQRTIHIIIILRPCLLR